MKDDGFEALFERLITAPVSAPGATKPALRQAVRDLAAELSLGAAPEAAPAAEVPAVVARYVEKVVREAYKTTDADVVALRAVDLTEDAIFEITIAAAVGAGMARHQRGLAALERRVVHPGGSA